MSAVAFRAAPQRTLPTASLADRLPQWDLLSLMSRTPQLETWHVRDHASGRAWALMTLREDVPDPRSGRAQLQVLSQACRGASCVHLPRIEAAYLLDDPPHLLLEWLDGETLQARLTRQGIIAYRDALWITRQCVEGLGELLSRGFSHGRLSAEHIFLSQEGQVTLVGLESAKPDSRIVDDLERLAERLDQTTHLDGIQTAESIPGNSVCTDLQSLGALLYLMLTGRSASTAAMGISMGGHRGERLLPRLRSLAPHVPREAEELADRLCSATPLRTGQTLRGLALELAGMELQSW
ncbi:MAG: hypothetical protein ACKV0T_11320 [Planctomycetales bacterium]